MPSPSSLWGVCYECESPVFSEENWLFWLPGAWNGSSNHLTTAIARQIIGGGALNLASLHNGLFSLGL